MKFHEFGDKKNPCIVLIHGGGNSWWNFLRQARILEKRYYVVLPSLDGHGEECKIPYASTEVSAKKIINYIDYQLKGKVFALCGVSLGGQIVIEMLSERADIAKKAIIEGTICYPVPFVRNYCLLTTKFTGRLLYGKTMSKILLKIMDRSMPEEIHYPEEIKKYYMMDIPRLPMETMYTIYRTYMNYNLKESLRKTKAEVMYLYGQKEMSCVKKSAELFCTFVQNCQIYELKGYNHGYLATYLPNEWVNIATDFFYQ